MPESRQRRPANEPSAKVPTAPHSYKQRATTATEPLACAERSAVSSPVGCCFLFAAHGRDAFLRRRHARAEVGTTGWSCRVRGCYERVDGAGFWVGVLTFVLCACDRPPSNTEARMAALRAEAELRARPIPPEPAPVPGASCGFLAHGLRAAAASRARTRGCASSRETRARPAAGPHATDARKVWRSRASVSSGTRVRCGALRWDGFLQAQTNRRRWFLPAVATMLGSDSAAEQPAIPKFGVRKYWVLQSRRRDAIPRTTHEQVADRVDQVRWSE